MIFVGQYPTDGFSYFQPFTLGCDILEHEGVRGLAVAFFVELLESGDGHVLRPPVRPARLRCEM